MASDFLITQFLTATALKSRTMNPFLIATLLAFVHHLEACSPWPWYDDEGEQRSQESYRRNYRVRYYNNNENYRLKRASNGSQEFAIVTVFTSMTSEQNMELDALEHSITRFCSNESASVTIGSVRREAMEGRVNLVLSIVTTSCSDVRNTFERIGNGNAKEKFSEEIQSRPYRSPEGIIGAGYGPAADIWSTACLAFELATGSYLFEPMDEDEDFPEDDYHLARMMELLGPIPRNLFMPGVLWRHFFAESDEMLNITVPNMSDKKARDLTAFLSPML